MLPAIIYKERQRFKKDMRDEKIKAEIKYPNCMICEDKGFISYKKRVFGFDYEFISHCVCEKGKTFEYEGSQCKQPSQYRIPGINEIFHPEILEEIKKENKDKWDKKVEKIQTKT